MKEVKLTKVTEAEIQVLQHELHLYSTQLGHDCKGSNTAFYNALMGIDIAFRLWVTFRKKIESENSKFTIRLKVSEAVIVLKSCCWARAGRNEFENHVAEKYKFIIDQQLKSMPIARE